MNPYTILRLLAVTLLVAAMIQPAFCQKKRSLEIDQDHPELWTLEGKGKWEIRDNILEITDNSINRDPFTAPSARAIYEGSTYANFELTAEIKSNALLSEQRGDMIIIFGYQSPTQYYYAHLTGTVDSIHNGVFVVDNADRRKVDYTEFEPVLLDREWHQFTLTRDVDSGSISVYLDGAKSPGIYVQDKTFTHGKIGFGSFNDPGEIRNVKIKAFN